MRTHRLAPRRGVTLLEGLISSVVLTVGSLAAFAGVMEASQQNSTALRMTRAVAMASEIRQGLELQGRARLFAPGGVLGNPAKCKSTFSGEAPYLDGLGNLTAPGMCVVDLDAVEDAVMAGATPQDMLSATHKFSDDYSAAAPDKSPYRRLLVRIPQPGLDLVAVVVSVKGPNRRVAVKQFAVLTDTGPTAAGGNGVGFDL